MANEPDPAVQAAQDQQREADGEPDTEEQFTEAAKDANMDNVSDILGMDDEDED